MNSSAHCFAFFIRDLAALQVSELVKLDEPEIVYRLYGVLRTRSGQRILLFDDTHNYLATIMACNKKVAVVKIEALATNQPLQPKITLCIGLAKKPAFEAAVYICAALGVQTVVPILSAQVERNWFGSKELARLQRISLNAREQAKSFWPTEIWPPILVDQIDSLPRLDFAFATKITFDKGGAKVVTLFEQPHTVQNLILLVGPEGGLTEKELQLLGQKGFNAFALCPTTLRTEDAVAVAVGLFRALM
jgi:16S rRNA (uracil1498-N3)-methyltransferase